jgi:hypothetical protein
LPADEFVPDACARGVVPRRAESANQLLNKNRQPCGQIHARSNGGFFCLFFAASAAVNLMSFLRRIHIGGKRAASQMLTVKNPSYSGQATLKG